MDRDIERRRPHRDFGGAARGEQHIGAFEVEVDNVAAVHLVQATRNIHRYLPTPGVTRQALEPLPATIAILCALKWWGPSFAELG